MARPIPSDPIQAPLLSGRGKRLRGNKSLCTRAASSCGGTGEQQENPCAGLWWLSEPGS